VTVLRVAAGRLGTAVRLAATAHPGALVGFLLTSVLGGLAPVATVWLAKVTVDGIAAGAGVGELWGLGAAFAAVGLAVATVAPVSTYLQAELERSVAMLAKDELYRAVTGIPLLGTLERPGFRDRLRLAEQASRSGPVQVVESALGLLQSGLTLAGMLAAVAVIEPWLALVFLAAGLPAPIAEIRLSRRRAEMAWRISPAERREFFYTDLLTSLSAAKELRLFGLSTLFRRRMLAELGASHAEQRRFDRREGATQVGLAAVSAVVAGGALVWVLLAAARGVLGVGDVAAVILVVGSVQSALAAAVNHVAVGHHAGLLLDHYLALVASPGRTAPPTAPLTAPLTALPTGPAADGAHVGVELDDVWFRYADDLPWVLRGVCATISPSEAVAIVGENGSGKSTLVKLLCRFYDPTRGSIRWNGVDLREIPLPELHSRIAAVFQDFMTYDLSAGENIALGDVDGRPEPDLSHARIEDAARRSEVHEALVALPDGYRTLLTREFEDFPGSGIEGVLLSGGQWQRLALARALLRGRRGLLILDEPSSGLDAEAEFRIHQEIGRYRRGRTSVLVSHRLNAVRDADRILVLVAGQIAERGHHDQLMAADGTYARLFRLQAAGYEQVPTP